VVVSANFLIDAEKQFQAALNGLDSGRNRNDRGSLMSARNLMLILIGRLVRSRFYALSTRPDPFPISPTPR